MKTSFLTKNSFQVLAIGLMFGFLMFFSGNAYGQAPVRGKLKKSDKISEATLQEAKVTAPVLTTVQEVGPMQIRLNVLNPTGEKVRINIRNYRNEYVFQDAFSGREYEKVLNFKITLPERYTLQVAGPEKSETRWFEINSTYQRSMTEAALEKKESPEVMATVFRNAPTQIKLHIVNNTGKPATYLFRNQADEVVDKGYVSKSQYTKAFDMANVPNGSYTFEVHYQGKKAASRTFEVQTVNERSFAWTDRRGRPLKPDTYSGVPLQSAPVTLDALK